MFYDRVLVSVTASGDTLVPGSAVAGYRGFSVVSEGDRVGYVIEDGKAWETGHGVWSGSSLTRELSESSTGSALSLTSRARLAITALAVDLEALGGGAVLSVNGQPGPEVTLGPDEVGAIPAGSLDDDFAAKADADLGNVDDADVAAKAVAGLGYSPVNPAALAAVATSGAYADLTGKPSLGDAAAKNTGTTAGTLAAGDDSRITGAAQKSSNLSDLSSVLTANANLGAIKAPVIAFLGDSITANGYFSNATSVLYRPYAHTTWAPILAGGRVWMPNGHNFGVVGDTAAMALARVSSVINASPKPSACVLLIGTNDITVATSAATIWTSILATVDALLNAGIAVIVMPILGRNATSTLALDAQKNAILNSVNRRIKALPYTRRNVWVADPGLKFNDPASAGSLVAPRSGLTEDGLHPSTAGGRVLGQAVADVLNLIFPPLDPTAQGAWENYRATDNPYGNLLANGALIGGGGTIYGTINGTAAGSVGASDANVSSSTILDNRSSGGATLTTARVTDSDGRAGLELTISGTVSNGGSASAIYWSQYATAGNVAVADVLEGVSRVEIAAGSQNIAGIAHELLTVEGGTAYTSQCAGAAGAGVLDATAWAGIYRTPRRTIAATATTVQNRHSILFKASASAQTVSGVIRIFGPSLNKVV